MSPPLAVLGVSATTQKSLNAGIEAFAGALEPFAAWDIEQLAEWLTVAEVYHRTGELPPPPEPARKKTSRAGGAGNPRLPKEPKPPRKTAAEVVAILRALQDREDADPSQVRTEIDAIDLTVAQIKEVQKEFLGVVVGKSKPDMLGAIRQRINEHHASRHRTQGIRNQ